MKAAIFYILVICFGLLGMHNYARATVHNGKLDFAATHNTVHKQVVEAGNFIDVEDENDEKDVTRRFTHIARRISTIFCTVFLIDSRNLSANNVFDGSYPDPTGAEICIEHRVLRI